MHSSERAYQCMEGDGQFMRPDHIGVHMQTHNKKTIPESPKASFMCDWSSCGKRFNKSDHLRKHMKVHEIQTILLDEKPFVCNWLACGTRFKRSDHLRRHERMHIGEKLYECMECDKKFVRSDHLTKHIKVHQTQTMLDSIGESFVCNWSSCGKSFKRRDHLQRHKRTHTGEKMYQCMECDKKFMRSCKLTDHMKIHQDQIVLDSDEESFVCNWLSCGKHFKRSDHLRRHELMHMGKKTFDCMECNMKFMRLDYLTKHMKIHQAQSTGVNLENIKLQNTGESIPVEVKIEIEDTVIISNELETVKSELLGDMSFDDKNKVPNISTSSTLQALLGFKNDPIVTQNAFINPNMKSPLKQPASSGIENNGRENQQRISCSCTNCSKGIQFMMGEKEHNCHIPGCKKVFEKTVHLQAHLTWHSDAKLFVCNSCGKCFNRRDHLEKHEKQHQQSIILDSNGNPLQMKVESQSSENEEIGEDHFDIDDANGNEDEPKKVKMNLNNKEDDWSLTPSAVSGDDSNCDEEMVIIIEEDDEPTVTIADPLDK